MSTTDHPPDETATNPTMSNPTMSNPTMSTAAADMQDERLMRDEGLRGAVAGFGRRVRAGDLGSLPVVIGLVVISVVFQILSGGIFLSPDNLVNLAGQSAAVGPIAIGVVLVLLLGEIDLSVGSVSGLGAAVLGVLLVSHGVPLLLVIVIALGVGAVIGLLYGVLYTRFGVPSFVITLAGLLAFLGAQILVLGPLGTINLPTDSALVQFAYALYLPPWLAYALGVVAAGALFVTELRRTSRRKRSGLSTGPMSITIVKSVALLVVLIGVTAFLATNRGLGASFVLFVVLVVVMNFAVRRTRWGRSIYAVGGNVEAARRSGINVSRVYISVFVLCSTFAVLGGLLSAGYLSAASQQSGTGDVNLNAIAAAVIGGTSLFGGRGSVWSALLGVIVIQSISSGLNLLNFDSSTRFIVTGIVLLLAVIIDSLSRRTRASSGAG